MSIVSLTARRATDGFAPPPDWKGHMLPSDDPVGGAYAAGRLANGVNEIESATPVGRVVACTHGDILPAYVAFVAAVHSLKLPSLPAQRGYWYTLEIESDSRISGRLNGPLADFPL